MGEYLYLDFYSFGALIGTIFTLAVSLFFLTLKDGSKPSRFYGWAFFSMFVMNVAYTLAAAFYHPMAAFHRWATVGGVFGAILFTVQIFFYFPFPLKEKAARVVLWVQAGISILITGTFIFSTVNGGIVYHFDGAYYDFDADRLSEIVGMFILLGILMFTAIGIWRSVVAETKDRMGIILLLVSLLITVLIPAIVNALSRQGLVDRELYQIFWSLMTLFGLFMLVIVYINHTTDKTPFMAKISGISLVTFLVVMQAVAYFVLGFKEADFDTIERQKARHILYEATYRPSEMKYVIVHDRDNSSFSIQEKDVPPEVTRADFRTEALFSIARERLSQATTVEDFNAIVEDVTKNLPSFSGYAALLKSNTQHAQTQFSSRQLLKIVDEHYRRLRYFRKKAAKTKGAKNIQKLLAEIKKKLPVFYQGMRSFAGSDLEKIKLCLTQFISPIKRLYRKDGSDRRHYYAYVLSFQGRIYEVGFDYRYYREFMHRPTLTLSWILFWVTLVIMFGFRYFFAKTLVNPLDQLIAGVSEVNQGDLNVKVPVHVEDEIGFLSRSFNDMVVSIRTAREKLQEYANQLEEKVKERTAQLQQTLEEVQALKVQQDGDYFLTSRLINPLGRNNASGEYTDIRFIVRQKKSFQFRKWEAEIGGDICMAHTLFLQDQKYIFFMNADAMGKSIQGAGGALVLGAVMESIIQRTNLSTDQKNMVPEKWLQYTLIELQKVFESFDGAMLISLVMGLVHDESGFMYYLNAEHPWAVLYRDEKANFIEDSLQLRKIGFMGVDKQVYIKTFSLLPGDSIFIGSDGKDDLVIVDENGEESINEDETLFLRVLEDSKGDLEKIPENLTTHGSLMDDLSLLEVHWKGTLRSDEFPPESEKLYREAHHLIKQAAYEKAIAILKDLHAQFPESEKILRDLVKAFLSVKDYAQAAGYALYATSVAPARNDMMYIASYASKLAGDYRIAADMGERLRLRDRYHLRNLVNLANVHLLLGNVERARKILAEAREIEPHDKKVQELEQAIEDSVSG